MQIQNLTWKVFRNLVPWLATAEDFTAAKPKILGRPTPTILASRTKEVDLASHHLEARTRYLISSICKNTLAQNSLSLLALIDALYQHVYDNIQTRSVAVDSGAVKVLTKITKLYEADVNILNRSRELLGLLGQNPPIKGQVR